MLPGTPGLTGEDMAPDRLRDVLVRQGERPQRRVNTAAFPQGPRLGRFGTHSPPVDAETRSACVAALGQEIREDLLEKGVAPHIARAPSGASGKELTCQGRRLKRWGLDPQVGKVPWRRAWQPTPVFLPGESHGQRSLAGYSSQGGKESDTATAT